MDKKSKINSIKNLYEITQILTKYNIKYWIQDGTLLGYYRDNDIINHDKDTDIGLFWDDFKNKKNAVNEILSKRFKLYKVKGNYDDSLMISFSKNGEWTDLFFYYHDVSYIYHCALGKKNRLYKFYYNQFSVKEINFKSYTFFAPENEEYFLETKYGSEWNIPKTKWKNITDPLNAIETDTYVDPKRSKKKFKIWLRT